MQSLSDAAARRPLRTGLLGELRSVAVREQSKRDSEGDLKQTYAVALLHGKPKGPRHSAGLVTGWSEPQAQQLAQWLAARLNIPFDTNPKSKRGTS